MFNIFLVWWIWLCNIEILFENFDWSMYDCLIYETYNISLEYLENTCIDHIIIL